MNKKGISVSRFVFLSFVMALGITEAKVESEIGFRLGVVDFQQALNGVDEGKSAKEALKVEFEKKQKDLSSREVKLEKAQKELEELNKQAQSGLLKPEAMEKGRKLESSFRKDLEEYTLLRKQTQEEMGGKEAKATQDIIRRLKDVMKDLGREGGFAMVLEANESGLVYAAQHTDLTEKLIQKFNALYKAKKPAKN